MTKDTADQHYEEKFEFELWKMIKKHAKEKDISYIQAAVEMRPIYEKGIRYRDTDFETKEIEARASELNALIEREKAEE